MANILIIDDQKWVVDLCEKGLSGEKHRLFLTNDIACAGENIGSFNPDIVLLNLYLKHGFLVWDVLIKLKDQNPDLPVLIVTEHDDFLFNPLLSKADGYIIRSAKAANELRQKISTLLKHRPGANQASKWPASKTNPNNGKKLCEISRSITTKTNSD